MTLAKSPEQVPQVPMTPALKITLVALLSAAAVVGRTITWGIPNVQPVTSIILIATVVLGIPYGASVAIITMLVTNLYMGMGVWTFFQIITYLILVLLIGILRRLSYFKKHLWIQIVFSFVAGFIYGFFISFLQAPVFGIQAFIPYWLQGLWYDLYHALGNAVFYSLLASTLSRLLKKYQFK